MIQVYVNTETCIDLERSNIERMNLYENISKYIYSE